MKIIRKSRHLKNGKVLTYNTLHIELTPADLRQMIQTGHGLAAEPIGKTVFSVSIREE